MGILVDGLHQETRAKIDLYYSTFWGPKSAAALEIFHNSIETTLAKNGELALQRMLDHDFGTSVRLGQLTPFT